MRKHNRHIEIHSGKLQNDLPTRCSRKCGRYRADHNIGIGFSSPCSSLPASSSSTKPCGSQISRRAVTSISSEGTALSDVCLSGFHRPEGKDAQSTILSGCVGGIRDSQRRPVPDACWFEKAVSPPLGRNDFHNWTGRVENVVKCSKRAAFEIRGPGRVTFAAGAHSGPSTRPCTGHLHTRTAR
jgi:hypothetical protein